MCGWACLQMIDDHRILDLAGLLPGIPPRFRTLTKLKKKINYLSWGEFKVFFLLDRHDFLLFALLLLSVLAAKVHFHHTVPSRPGLIDNQDIH